MNSASVEASYGNNLDSAAIRGFNQPGDFGNTEPKLGPLQYYGGPTPTHALPAGSRAIDAGSGCLAVGQRGFARPYEAACDIGAFGYRAEFFVHLLLVRNN